MNKYKPFVLLFACVTGLVTLFHCGELNNPLDTESPDYIKTQITILLDSTGIDSLFYTDTPVRVGIIAKAKPIMDRLTKIIVDYGNGVVFEKQKPSGQSLLELWCDSSFTFSSAGEKLIQVKAVTLNEDDILDSVYVTINGISAYITSHPQVFATPFEEKDSLHLSVSGAGTAPLSYQWYKDSLYIDSIGDSIAVLKTLTGKTHSYFTIPVLNLSDSGYYCCKVSNIFGADTSDKTFIRVIPETPDSTWPSVYFATNQAQGVENTNGSITILLSKPYNKDNVTVKLKVNASSTALQGVDYNFSDTSITFPAGETVKNVTVSVTDDQFNESNETVVLDIVSAKNGVVVEDSTLSCTYTIIDNDESQVKFNSVTASLTETDNTTLKDSILVILTGQNDKTATIDYAVITDSSTADGDSVDFYIHGSGTLTFPAFSDSAWISLSVMGDTIAEGGEIVILRLSNPTGGISLAPSNTICTYTIRDNDIVTVAFDGGQQTDFPESDSVMVFSVSLSKKCNETVTSGYRVKGGSATGGGTDYTLQGNGMIAFPAKTLQQFIRVSITEDNLPEPDETIILELHATSQNAALGSPKELTATILDNEIPVVFFKQASLSAFESVTTVSIPVTLTFSPFDTVKIPYTVKASSTALQNVDFSLASSALVFAPGDTVEKNITFTVVNDKLDETDETVVLNIGVPVNATVGTNSSCTYNILDDEYVITPATSGSGTIIPASDTIVSRGDSLILSASSSLNWDFVNWIASSGLNLVNASSQNALLRNIETNGTVTANFKTDSFTVDIVQAANGSITPTVPQRVPRGGSFGITATANSHYHFYAWNPSQGLSVADVDTAKTTVVNVQTDGSVSAVFAPDTYSVTVAQIPSGAGSMPSVGTQSLAYGTELSLSAVPNAGYAFSGW